MKTSRRTKKVSSLIHQKLGNIISEEITANGMGIITVTEVSVSIDLRQARVYYTVYSGTLNRDRQQAVIESKAKVIRKRLAESVELKYIPFLNFIYDETPEKASKIEKIIQQIKNEKNKK